MPRSGRVDQVDRGAEGVDDDGGISPPLGVVLMEHGERAGPQERLPVGAGGVGLEGVVGERGGRLLLLAGLEETEGSAACHRRSSTVIVSWTTGPRSSALAAAAASSS